MRAMLLQKALPSEYHLRQAITLCPSGWALRELHSCNNDSKVLPPGYFKKSKGANVPFWVSLGRLFRYKKHAECLLSA